MFALGGNVLWSEFPVFPSQPWAEVSVSGEKSTSCSFPGKMVQERSAPFSPEPSILSSYHFDDKLWFRIPEVFPPTNWHPKKIDATSGPWAFLLPSSQGPEKYQEIPMVKRLNTRSDQQNEKKTYV